MDTEEMYRRGIADAERGEAHPFYYQHYYQYRRGYDRARRSQGLPGGFYDVRRRRITRLAAATLVLAVVAGGYWLWRGRAQNTASALNPSAVSSTLAPPTPSRTPIFPTPTVAATPTPAVLAVGGSARVVNTEGAALRSRKQPRLNAPTTATFKEGDTVRVLEGPIDADGFTWWRIEGSGGTGWSAQQSKEGLVWLLPAPAQ